MSLHWQQGGNEAITGAPQDIATQSHAKESCRRAPVTLWMWWQVVTTLTVACHFCRCPWFAALYSRPSCLGLETHVCMSQLPCNVLGTLQQEHKPRGFTHNTQAVLNTPVHRGFLNNQNN
ncbi:hypothetical protein VOLCADRAFT_95853 [Volvox carteri f. nagariensis]|uniref:Uncharacterized protein n=1 Tax=Volvox carteri f. nagariensis TaxID=3068 RepID=D8U8J7_VOLCA|nr:uncharacterized protein VOLCADRAFT_95853 [Volvox carteri f. nagariensis]EFJ43935.1 hypothetical protein VOLCADRAFT_95853 [Volvox carteri f. nagariensis]|eukprot:XP_002954947.1 hypothetical protein VOLCADRAFT_95853 [Volvox carteri f. nagariensis]